MQLRRAGSGRRVPRGDLAPPRLPDARASALRAGARHRGRADPRRLRRRPAARCARELDKYLQQNDRAVPARARSRSPSRRSRSAACCRRPCCTCRARSEPRSRPATCSPRCCSSTSSYAAQLLDGQGVTRLDVLNYISHGISKVPPHRRPRVRTSGRPPPAQGEEGSATARDSARRLRRQPDRARRSRRARPADRPRRRAAADDRGALPPAQEQPGVRRRSRASARPRWPKASRSGCCRTTCRRSLKDAEVFSLDTGALLAGTRFRGDFEERFKAVVNALAKRPKPILFIDEMHSTVGAGATTGGTMDLATLIKPVLTAGELRVDRLDDVRGVQADREGPRARAPAAEDRRSTSRRSRRPSGSSRACAAATRSTTACTYTDAALEAAAKLAGAAPARLPPARQRHRRDRRGRRGAAAAAATERPRRDRRAEGRSDVERLASADPTSPARRSQTRRATVDVAEIERVVARMARIPDKQASSSDRERLRTLEESLKRVVFGQDEAVQPVAQAIKRSRAGLGQPDRPAGCFLFTGPDRRRQDRARQAARACSSATSSSAST